MRCKIVRFQKLMWRNIMKSTKSQKTSVLHYNIDWIIFNLCQKKNYIILNFNYLMINTFLVIFLNQKVGSILNPIRKVSLSILPTTFWTTKYIYIYSTKEVKGIKIIFDFIFNNFPVHRTGLRLVKEKMGVKEK